MEREMFVRLCEDPHHAIALVVDARDAMTVEAFDDEEVLPSAEFRAYLAQARRRDGFFLGLGRPFTFDARGRCAVVTARDQVHRCM